jgi:class 3 adenylate cyclase
MAASKTARGKQTRASAPKREEEIPANLMSNFDLAMQLGRFIDSGRRPQISHVEVIVCFVDLRGFTDYVHTLQQQSQDNRVQNFLKHYFAIFPRAMIRRLWHLSQGIPGTPFDGRSQMAHEVKGLAVPRSYKNLGDGMMLVWELQNASSETVQAHASLQIFDAIQEIAREFRKHLPRDSSLETDMFTDLSKNLKLGIGIARGHAWKLDFGHGGLPDYAGSIINLASRLQEFARPEGIVAQLAVAEPLFKSLTRDGANTGGRLERITNIRGFKGGETDVWVSEQVRLKDHASEPKID